MSTEKSCTCRSVWAGTSRVGTAVSDDCPDHGFGTEYHREQAEYWNRRLRELREKKRQKQRKVVD